MADGDISSQDEAASLAGVGGESTLRAMEALDSAAEHLEALTPLDRESVCYSLLEEAGASSAYPERANAFEALERIVRASGLVAGRCRICGCTEDNACRVPIPPVDEDGVPEDERPCGWADAEETLCDAPSCVEAAAKEPK